MGDFRETLYTIDQRGRRHWVYPTIVRGYFYKRRTVVAAVLIAIYILMPWITIGSGQAVLLDIVNRKFTFFGTTFWATDTVALALVLLGLGLSLFFFTAILGRVWCGWACPETVFLEFLFRPIETWIEGNAAQRQKLDNGPWTLEKIRKKFLKYLIYVFFCWVLANTALAYFVGRERLIVMMQHSPLLNPSTFLVSVALMLVLIFQFGWFREQFCTVLCPYARFQSVLLDPSSLLVGYDKLRGEPRGKISKDSSGKGDCIDCGLCVRVCPTGIDIRNGTQLECIHCAECVDACDSIMEKVGRPSGLIRYDTEARFEGRKDRIIRPRILAYGALLFLVGIGLTKTLLTREESDMQVVRGPRDLPFAETADGRVSNHLHLHLSNKSETVTEYSVKVISPAGVELVVPIDPFPVPAGDISMLPLFFTFKRELLIDGKLPVTIGVTDKHGYKAQQTVTLLGPG